MRHRVAAAVAILCLSAFSVYTSYVVLDHTDPVTNRTFRAVSLEDYRLAVAGHGPFPYQWRMLGNWTVAAGERLTGADPHAVDLVLKVTALALSAWALALFSVTLVSSPGVVAVLGLYFALSSAAYASQGYSIYYTADYFMIAGWFWAVYFASQQRWMATAIVVFLSAWAKETLLLAPLLLVMRWRRGRVSFAQLTMVGIAFAVPVAVLRLMYRAPLGEWAWWQTIRVNVPFLVWDRRGSRARFAPTPRRCCITTPGGGWRSVGSALARSVRHRPRTDVRLLSRAGLLRGVFARAPASAAARDRHTPTGGI